jgi:hypothetical protein
MKHKWVYRTTGFLGTDHDVGPIDESELLNLARQGNLTRDLLVSSPTRTSGNWFTLAQIPGLVKALEDGDRARADERAAELKRFEEEQQRAREAAEKTRQLEDAARAVTRPPPLPSPAYQDSQHASNPAKLDVQCPNCKRVLEAGLADTRQTIPCPACRCPIALPAAAEVTPFAQEPPTGAIESDSRVTLVNGQVQVRCQSPADAKLAIKELKLLKKTLGLQKKQAMEHMRIIRAQYTASVCGRGSKIRGGGFIGKVVRAAQTISRDGARAELARRLHPYECERQRLEELQHQIDTVVLQVQMTFEL